MSRSEPTTLLHGPRSHHGHSSRLLLVAYASLALGSLIFWSVYLVRQPGVLGYGYRTDFVGIYIGARAVATGNGIHLFELGEQRELMDAAVSPYHRDNLMAFVYPGYVAVLLAPLGFMPFRDAVIVFAMLNFAVACWIAWLITASLVDNPAHRPFALFAFVAFIPLHLTLLQNQLGLFPTLAFIKAILALRSHQFTRAGWWLIPALLKPQLIVFPIFAFVLWRCWGVLRGFLLGTCLVLGVSFAVLGWWIPHYLRLLREYMRAAGSVSLFPALMQNWRGLLYSLFHSDTGAFWITLLVLTLLSLLAAFIAIRSEPLCWKQSGENAVASSSRSWETGFALVILLGVLSSPHLYMHDWVAFAPAGVLLWEHVPVMATLTARISRVLLSMCPFVFLIGQFGPRHSLPVVPWFMGVVAVCVLATVIRSEKVSKPMNSEHRLPFSNEAR